MIGTRILFGIFLAFALIGFVSASECTDNQGICTLSCPVTYSISSHQCEGVSAVCCVPTGDFTCQSREGYMCSTLNFQNSWMSKYTPEDYGLREAPITEGSCPYSLICYQKTFNVYNGAGNYSLTPGDEIHFDKGYVVKYVNFNRGANYGRPGEEVSANIASLSVYNGEIDYSNLAQNQIASFGTITNTEKDKIRTFARGFYLYADPLAGSSNVVNLEIFTGALSSCTDTDAYSLGNTILEEQTGKWGRNYYQKGTATELSEDNNGPKTTTSEDICSDGKLTEYYCDGGNLKSEEKSCTCKDAGSCNKGFFDSIWELFGKYFGNLN